MKKRPLSLGVWDTRPITYAEWVELAGRYADQNAVWASHEHHARKNYTDEPSEWRDYGGEA